MERLPSYEFAGDAIEGRPHLVAPPPGLPRATAGMVVHWTDRRYAGVFFTGTVTREWATCVDVNFIIPAEMAARDPYFIAGDLAATVLHKGQLYFDSQPSQPTQPAATTTPPARIVQAVLFDGETLTPLTDDDARRAHLFLAQVRAPGVTL